MNIDECEWQMHDANEWVFGLKVRGIVREPMAEVYFDGALDDHRGGWNWIVHRNQGLRRGLSLSLCKAVEMAEVELTKTPGGGQ